MSNENMESLDGCESIPSLPSRLDEEHDELTGRVKQIFQNPDLMELLNERKRDRAHLSLEDVYQKLGLEDEISS